MKVISLPTYRRGDKGNPFAYLSPWRWRRSVCQPIAVVMKEISLPTYRRGDKGNPFANLSPWRWRRWVCLPIAVAMKEMSLPTYRRGDEGDLFGLFPVVVDGQVPDAGVHVLDEACIVIGHRHQATLGADWSLQAPSLRCQQSPPIQELHKVKLANHREDPVTLPRYRPELHHHSTLN